MKVTFKKLLALLLALAMIFSLPVVGFAEENTEEALTEETIEEIVEETTE